MKGIAIILTGCLLLLGAANLPYVFQVHGQGDEAPCCCCCDPEGEKPNDEQDACDAHHECLPACNCSYQFQITALEYRYMEVPGVTVHSFLYGNYLNNYTFEYTVHLLHPPRFA